MRIPMSTDIYMRSSQEKSRWWARRKIWVEPKKSFVNANLKTCLWSLNIFPCLSLSLSRATDAYFPTSLSTQFTCYGARVTVSTTELYPFPCSNHGSSILDFTYATGGYINSYLSSQDRWQEGHAGYITILCCNATDLAVAHVRGWYKIRLVSSSQAAPVV